MLITAFALLLAAYSCTCYYFSSTILYLNRQPVTRNPREYGMEYEDVGFRSSDGVNLKGWLIPGRSDGLVIMAHPGGFNRQGLSMEHQGLVKMGPEVDFLPVARQLNRAGYWVLMFDFRNHGESEVTRSGIAGVGLDEYRDILAALDYVKQEPRLGKKKVGFVSFCMGANSTIIAMSKSPGHFKHVRCLLAVQPISTDVFVRSYTRDSFTKPVAMLLLPVVRRLVVLRGGHPLEEMSPGGYCKDIRVPVLYVQAETDPWTELSDIRSFYERTPGKKELLMLKGRMARFDTYNYFGRKPERMLDFLGKHL